jgi:signal transduction histidine kinase/DNA-directed RNA polymerase subunit L
MAARARLRASAVVRVGAGFLVFVQSVLLLGTILAAVFVSGIPGSSAVRGVLILGVILAVVSVIAISLPWHRLDSQYQVVVAVIDLVLVTLLCEVVLMELPGLSIMVLVPVLWLSYAFGLPWAIFAIAGNSVVALLPYLRMGRLPQDSVEWGSIALPTAIVAALTLAVHIIANRDRTRRNDLIAAYENLRVSVALGVDGDEKLRVSVASGIEGAEALRVSVAEGIEGAEALRVSVAEGVDSAEALRVSVAEGVDSAEALRVSVAEGVDNAEALRVSVAEGLEGAEALRVSVAEGIEGAEALRVSVAEGVDNAEALRVSVAQNVDSAEALRLSVMDGLESAKALQISVEEGESGAEALRVSIADGLDAASTALTVVDTVDAGITFYDPHGAVMFTNDTARNLLIASRSGQSHHASGGALVFEEDRVTPVAIDDYIFARAARGELVTRRSYWVGFGAAQRAVIATSQFVRRADGKLIGTVIATHDVTPLADAIEARDQFLTTVSHELRTPLTSMIGYLELIEDSIDVGNAGIEHEFAVVQRNSQRLLALITDLLTTAEGQATLVRRQANMVEVAAAALDEVRAAAITAGVTVTMPATDAVIAEVDAVRVRDALGKILSNAVKFNRPGGTIVLTVKSAADSVVVRISDTGIGMSAEELPFVFDRFFRGSTSRSGEVAGTGLGLSTAKLVVEAHHGEITARSVLGEGSTVEFRLPLLVGARPRRKKRALEPVELDPA